MVDFLAIKILNYSLFTVTHTDSSGGLLHIAQFHDEGIQLCLWPLGKSESDGENHYQLLIENY